MALTTEINANPGTERYPKLLHALADRAEVAEVPEADPLDPPHDPICHRLIPNGLDPPSEWHDTIRSSIEANLLLNRHERTLA